MSKRFLAAYLTKRQLDRTCWLVLLPRPLPIGFVKKSPMAGYSLIRWNGVYLAACPLLGRMDVGLVLESSFSADKLTPDHLSNAAQNYANSSDRTHGSRLFPAAQVLICFVSIFHAFRAQKHF